MRPRTSPVVAPCLALVLLAASTSPLRAEVVVRVPADAATLSQAVSLVPNGGTIELDPGTYASPAGGFQLGGLGKSFTIRAAVAGTVALDGGDARPVLRVDNASLPASQHLVFENLTFRHGLSTTNAVAGGVTLTRARATFVDCAFENNVASPTNTGGGGAAAFQGSTAFFVRARFEGNVAKNEGAGLRVGDGSLAHVHESVFLNNLANPSGHRNTAAGGAIHVGDAHLRVTDSRFEGNRAGYVGGAIYAIGTWTSPVTTPQSTVEIANSTFVDNAAVLNAPASPQGAPTEGGAVHAEDQATVRIVNSRFDGNAADTGGGVNLYRAIVEIEDSVFRGNRAVGQGASTGFGGAISAISNDTGIDGTTNRREASLTVRDSLLLGRYGAVTTVAQSGGCVSIHGDKNREFGTGGTSIDSDAANRATLLVERSAFVDCDVAAPNNGGKGVGGGLSVELTTMAMSDSLVLASEAAGAQGMGGGLRFVIDAVGTATNTVFAGNAAGNFGGGVAAQGSDLDLVDCLFLHNTIGPAGGAQLGSALFTSILESYQGRSYEAKGTVSGSTFAENEGVPIFDDDRLTVVNRVVYDGNSFYPAGDVYQKNGPNTGVYTAAGLNGLLVDRTGSANDVDKSTVANVALGSAPALGAIRAVPPAVLGESAVGDPAATTPAWVAYAWSGGAATLDGASVSGFTGLSSVGPGSHTLAVGGAEFTASIAFTNAPTASLSAVPMAISSGDSSTLVWSTTGTHRAAALDQALGTTLAASGNQAVSPVATTTYRLLTVADEGGALGEATVLVDEVPPLFEDGFETGNTSGWGGAVP